MGLQLSQQEMIIEIFQRKEKLMKFCQSLGKKLLDEKDEILLELISDKVERLCGYKPDFEVVEEFLSSIEKSIPK